MPLRSGISIASVAKHPPELMSTGVNPLDDRATEAAPRVTPATPGAEGIAGDPRERF
jgi:hypothetical protein